VTVAFPLISSGIFRWPKEDAVRQAVAGIRAAEPSSVEEVRLVLFDEATFDVAHAVLES
jgi:O-acetyl-ADP-ribose deacetylase (regulator of RNase III)